MVLDFSTRAAIIFALDSPYIGDFEVKGPDPDFYEIASRTGIDVKTLKHIWSDSEAFFEFRIDPNAATLEQFAQMPDLEAASLSNFENARPFFSLLEVEAASGIDGSHISQIFSDPVFELPGNMFADQTLVPALDAGFILTADVLPPKEMFEALGFRFEPWSQTPTRAILYQVDGYDAAALNTAKALAGGRIFPAVRDLQGFTRFYMPGWMDVWFVAGTSRASAEEIFAATNMIITGWNEDASMAEVRLASMPNNRDVLGATFAKVRELKREAQVELIEPKQFAHDDEPDFDNAPQDFLEFGTGNPQWHRAMIRLDEAQTENLDGDSVTVFVIDSGIDLSHPDLREALRDDWADHDLDYGCGPETDIPDARGTDHGTGVASLAVGRASAVTFGVRGVATNVKLIPIRIEGRNCDYNNRALAIRKAIQLTTDDVRGVINISWQTEGSHEGIYLALKKAAEADIAIVTSAGNYRSFDKRQADKPHYPSGYGFSAPLASNGQPMFKVIPAVCSVGAVASDGKRSSYSYFGDNAVTLAAPGGESGGPGQSLWIAMVNTAYGFGHGTSFAAPLVTGALAVLLVKNKKLSALDAIKTLRQTARQLDADSMLGAGLIDIEAALDVIAKQPACDITSAPQESDSTASESQHSDRVNVNLADQIQLETVPMLGPFFSHRIIAQRDSSGPFGTLDEFRIWLGADDWAWSTLSHHISV